ncbi:putative RING-H2 zinc finger protein RHA1a [Iris pallida]|uniref:RING-H2 zinc finger protein RHA1a n=1 Tax=Iris pallida TaxID=29817 RepID=A0AAX6GNH4_IRIPA|nr:putative RING-H2 zinc finger protein RHA1a [Iris pallida]
MGFPMGYTELLFPKLILQLVFLLGHVRRLISWAFDKAGLGDLVDSDRPWPSEEQQHLQQYSSFHPDFQSVSSLLIEEILPVVLYRELAAAAAEAEEEENCAVCLYELEAADEVRRLSNCRHVFHKGCLDRWMDHDQRTCPLCRTPLIPDEMQDAFNERIWAAAGLPDSFSSQLHQQQPQQQLLFSSSS